MGNSCLLRMILGFIQRFTFFPNILIKNLNSWRNQDTTLLKISNRKVPILKFGRDSEYVDKFQVTKRLFCQLVCITQLVGLAYGSKGTPKFNIYAQVNHLYFVYKYQGDRAPAWVERDHSPLINCGLIYGYLNNSYCGGFEYEYFAFREHWKAPPGYSGQLPLWSHKGDLHAVNLVIGKGYTLSNPQFFILPYLGVGLRILTDHPWEYTHTFFRPMIKLGIGLGWRAMDCLAISEEVQVRAVLRPYYPCELSSSSDLHLGGDAFSFSFVKVVFSL